MAADAWQRQRLASICAPPTNRFGSKSWEKHDVRAAPHAWPETFLGRSRCLPALPDGREQLVMSNYLSIGVDAARSNPDLGAMPTDDLCNAVATSRGTRPPVMPILAVAAADISRALVLRS